MASGTIKNVLKTTIPTVTTGEFGNATLATSMISREQNLLAVYCDGFICLPRRVSSAWTIIVYELESSNVVLAKNATLTDVDIVYR